MKRLKCVVVLFRLFFFFSLVDFDVESFSMGGDRALFCVCVFSAFVLFFFCAGIAKEWEIMEGFCMRRK